MNRFRLYMNEPFPGDSTSTYRGNGVLGPLEKSIPGLSLQPLNDYHNWYGNVSDGLFLQRPFQEAHFAAMKMAQEHGNKVWCDWDDDLLTVDTNNPAWACYNDPKTRKMIMDIVSNADFISVTTDGLAKTIKKFNPNVEVVHNALHDKLLQWRQLKPSVNTVYIRGGSSHERDWRGFTSEIMGAFSEHKKWNWFVQGWRPWFWLDDVDPNRFRFKEWVSHIAYLRSLVAEAPKLCIVPLADTKFNESKSNIAWMEAAYAGAAALVPDWLEWRKPGAITYKNNKEFKEKLNACLNGEIDLASAAAESWNYVLDNLLLSTVNLKRVSIMERMGKK